MNAMPHFVRNEVALPAAPQFWQTGKSGTPYEKKTALSEGKTEKNLSKFFWRLANTYKKYILQKNWVKTVIPALSSGRSNLQRPIWGCHRQLDDRDHLVGQLTTPSHKPLHVVHIHRVQQRKKEKMEGLTGTAACPVSVWPSAQILYCHHCMAIELYCNNCRPSGCTTGEE